MASGNDNPTVDEAMLKPLVDEWTACLQRAHADVSHTAGHPDASADRDAWRRAWFERISRETDRFLRSPEFLGLMKSRIDALIADRMRADASHERVPAAGTFSWERPDQAIESLEDAARKAWTQWDQVSDAASVRQSITEQVLAEPNPRPGLSEQGESLPGATASEVVYREGTLRLLRYRADPARYREPVLVCFALVNRPYILDLRQQRSVVRRLLGSGFDVYLIDWGIPRESDRHLRIQDYVCRLLHHVVEFTCRHAGVPHVTLMGYCMGGTLSTMYAALWPRRVRNLVLLATPIDFDNDEGLLRVWAQSGVLDVDGLVAAYGNCPGEFLRCCFQLMAPVQNFAEKYLRLCENLDDDAFLGNFLALERWAHDSVPVAGETFREYVSLLYRQNRLVRGELTLDGEAVQLSRITCPVLMLAARYDHLVPPASTLALENYVQSQEVQSMSIDAGHIGLAVSSRAHRRLWPRAIRWLAGHSTMVS